jgi:signal transduction histidine kinase
MRARRWRLFPKYALLIIMLVGSMLIVSSGITIYFSYRENEAHLVALQNEKAQSAARRIEQYVLDIQHQLSWTTFPPMDSSGDAFEARRIEYIKLQKQAEQVTEVAWIDPSGREQLRISRLAIDSVSTDTDMSKEPKFLEASAGRLYYGPVYFRKGTEPYMTIARPAGSGGGVTAAEVNLKFVWEVVSRIKIGEAGLAYVVDSTGTLIAHPDISLVLKKSDLNSLPQVAALTRPDGDEEPIGRDLKGDEVFTAHASIPTLRWTVFVESPRAEALAPLYASLVRAALLLVAGLVVSTAATFFVARALVRPLQALQEGAARVGAGELDRRIEVHTGDELENLAEQFNQMGAALRASYEDLERKVEQRTAELTDSLARQTATSEVLKLISRSTLDLDVVLRTLLESASRLCGAAGAVLYRPDADGRYLPSVVHLAVDPESRERYLARLRDRPIEVGEGSAAGRAILHRRTVHIDDVHLDPAYQRHDIADVAAFRNVLAVPLLRQGEPIGVIALSNNVEGVSFTQGQIELATTFADQAVIAIENARLFNETKEALEQQTATANILGVISRSVADTQPVFEAILESCERLFDGLHVGITLAGEDGLVRLAAQHGDAANREQFERSFPVPLSAESGSGLAILERRVVHYPDVQQGADVPHYVKRSSDAAATRSVIIAPLLWEGRGIGTIFVGRRAAGPFSEKDIALLKTFADQAVIAIQNARLFNETREALEQQTATAEVLQVISSSVADANPVFDKILDSCERLFSATGLGIYLIDDAGMLHLGGFRGNALGLSDPVREVGGVFPRPLEGTATALAVRERRVVHFADALGDPHVPPPLRRVAEVLGNFSIAFAPMLWEDRGVGAIQVSREPTNPFTEKELVLLKTFADQAVIAIQNSRFFNEIQSKSRELELANKHKSEFLANMSHELRTPLNAIIGFSEVLSEKMFGEVNEKQLEYLLDIHSSGHHLLQLINDILDLSKIEAGRMDLDLATVNLPMLLDNCTTLVRERASRQGLTLSLEVETGLGDWVADIRKVKQVVINLLSNAVKFTPSGGRVTLRARRVAAGVEIAVIDTGVGIAPEDQALVFEEFRQAGGDYLRKSEGTGLGLSLAKRFVELHGGSMRVDSAPGKGSTFAFILPERVLEAI